MIACLWMNLPPQMRVKEREDMLSLVPEHVWEGEGSHGFWLGRNFSEKAVGRPRPAVGLSCEQQMKPITIATMVQCS